MQNYQNTDVYTRTWDHLIDLASGGTLRLEPDEETTEGVGIWTDQTKTIEGPDGPETVPDPTKPPVVGDLPTDFSDAWLKPVGATESAPALSPLKPAAPPQVTTPAAPGATQTEPAADGAAPPKE